VSQDSWKFYTSTFSRISFDLQLQNLTEKLFSGCFHLSSGEARSCFLLLIYNFCSLFYVFISLKCFFGLFNIWHFLHIRPQILRIEIILFFLCILNSFHIFYCLILLTRTFNNILNRYGQSQHSFLFPDFKGKSVSLLLLVLIVTVDFSYN
jgi:hypothetical protein